MRKACRMALGLLGIVCQVRLMWLWCGLGMDYPSQQPPLSPLPQPQLGLLVERASRISAPDNIPIALRGRV